MEDKDFCNFFYEVLQIHFIDFAVRETDVCTAIHHIQFAYSREGQRLSFYLEPVNYNHPACRCAYLYKYAGFHAAMVNHVLSSYLRHTTIFRSISLGKNDVMNICCLGGGPGTDICGLSNTLSQKLDVKKFAITTIDAMNGWASVFDTMLKLDLTNYKYLAEFFSRIVFNEYICDNLLFPGNETKRALQSADLVTMIKFVSAVKQYRVTDMLKELFRELKPGALVLFIDNDAGGFHEMVYQAATECCLTELCKPLRHIKFESDVFRNRMFGSSRLSYCTVTAQVWMANDSSSFPTEIIRDSEDYVYPYSTEPLPLLTPAGNIEKCFTNPVDTTSDINIQASIQNEQEMVGPVIEDDSLETDDVSYKTGNFMIGQTSLIPTFQEPSGLCDGMEDYFKRYEDASLTKIHVDDDTEIQHAGSVESEAPICSEMFLEDSVQEEARENDFRQKPPAEDSSLKTNLRNASPVEQNKEIDKCDACGTLGNTPRSSADSILTTIHSRNFPASVALSSISTPKGESYLVNEPNRNQRNHLQEKLVSESFGEIISRNRSDIKVHYETDYESISVFVLTLFVYFIFLSYYFK